MLPFNNTHLLVLFQLKVCEEMVMRMMKMMIFDHLSNRFPVLSIQITMLTYNKSFPFWKEVVKFIFFLHLKMLFFFYKRKSINLPVHLAFFLSWYYRYCPVYLSFLIIKAIRQYPFGRIFYTCFELYFVLYWSTCSSCYMIVYI